MAPRDPKRALTILGITSAVLAVVAACSYWYWGWTAVVLSPTELDYAYLRDPADFAAAKKAAAEARLVARTSRYASFAFGGVVLGCAAFAAWHERREWREWPWPSLVCLVPALLAFAFSLVGGASNAVVVIALAVEVVCAFAAFFDLARTRRGSPSRPLSWSVLVTSLLALLIRPLLPWH